MSIVAPPHFVPPEQTPDSGLVPVVVTKLPDGVEVWRDPATRNLKIDGLDGMVELTPAAEAALAMLIMLDGAQ